MKRASSLRAVVAASLLAATLAGGCGGSRRASTSSGSRPPSPSPPSDPTNGTVLPGAVTSETTCSDIIDEARDGGERGRRVVLDTVAIRAGYVPGSRPLTTPTGGSDFRFFAKDGLLVRGNLTQPVFIEVPEAWRDRIAVGWGSPARASAVVKMEPCRSEARWVVYAGGFFVNEPVCAPITVRVGKRRTAVPVGVAVDCGEAR